MTDKPPPWQPCDFCDEFICNIHIGNHVWECDCPGIDDWSATRWWPYDSPVTAEMITWVGENPFSEDEDT